MHLGRPSLVHFRRHCPVYFRRLSPVHFRPSIDRLTSESGGPWGTRSYEYDDTGNRTRLSADRDGTPTRYLYDKVNYLANEQFHPNGNLEARNADRFSYDQENRLTQATVGGTVTTYAYDEDGNRASKTVGTNRPSATFTTGAI